MSLTRKYKTDKDIETNGYRYMTGYNDDTTRPTFVLRRVHPSNKAYQVVVDRHMEPHRPAQAAGVLPPEVQEAAGRDAFAEGALIGWENIPLADVTGNAADKGYVPYSVENATRLLKNLPELYDDLFAVAIARENYQTAVTKGAEKNS